MSKGKNEPEEGTKATMKRCPKCGRTYSDTVMVCPACEIAPVLISKEATQVPDEREKVQPKEEVKEEVINIARTKKKGPSKAVYALMILVALTAVFCLGRISSNVAGTNGGANEKEVRIDYTEPTIAQVPSTTQPTVQEIPETTQTMETTETTPARETAEIPFLYEIGEWYGESCGTYWGEVSDGQANGEGKLTLAHGGQYTGSFQDSYPKGEGTYTYVNGKSISGDFSWSTGRNYTMEESKSGNGPHYNGTDMVYIGMLKDDMPCGFGMLDFLDGGTFYGEFRDGTVHGEGTYLYQEPDPDSDYAVTGSDWEMVHRIQSPSDLGGRWYSGLICDGMWQGYGMLCYNYSYYIGEVKNYYCHGHGTYWKWSQQGDPSGTLTRKDYGHYQYGRIRYSCSHGSK